MSWGPQPDGTAALPSGPPRQPGGWLLVVPIVVGALGFVFGGFVLLVIAMLASQHNTGALTGIGAAAAMAVLLVMLVAAGIRFGTARARTGWFYRRPGIAVTWGLLTPPLFVAYSAGYLIGASLAHRRPHLIPGAPAAGVGADDGRRRSAGSGEGRRSSSRRAGCRVRCWGGVWMGATRW